MSSRATVATEQVVEEVAHVIAAKGNAVDAAVAAVFAAAAVHPSVLLGPVHLLLVGQGIGHRAIDGRSLQPGRRARRPRGFVDAASIPPAARVASPRLPGALLLALAMHGKCTPGQVLGPARDLAKGSARGGVLAHLERRGAPGLLDAAIWDALARAAGPLEGGLLTQADLADARPDTTPCALTREGADTFAHLPWVADDREAAGESRIVIASDRAGTVALAAYEVHAHGVHVPDLDLVAPLQATPVCRGTPRVAPGTPCASWAALAVREKEGVVEIALGGPRQPLAALLRAVGAHPFVSPPGSVALLLSRRGAQVARGGPSPAHPENA